MAEPTVRLLEVEPDIGQFLSREEQADAAELMVPVARISPGRLELSELLAERRAFAGMILDGMVLAHPRLGAHRALRLLGPGDVIAPHESRSALLSQMRWTVAPDTEVMILGDELLAAARQWPRLVGGLNARLAEQAQRLEVQLLLCQLPRVSDRVLGMMWLLAESWGRVTAAGVTLPLALTHEMIGEMIGARRPTVSLAVGELVRRGAILRQDRGWLLLEPLAGVEVEVEADVSDASAVAAASSIPVMLESLHSPWAETVDTRPANDLTHEAMRATVERLRLELEENQARVRQLIESSMQARASVARRRAKMANGSRGRPAPSS